MYVVQDESLTVVHCVDGRDFASQSLHTEGGHCVADITWGGSAIDFSFDDIVIAWAVDLPGRDLFMLLAIAL